MQTESAAVGLGLEKAFLTATLLTGSSRCAESALMVAILHWDLNEDALLRGAVEASLQYCAFPEEKPEAIAVADALRDVLKLSPRLRRCYVLRALMQWPATTCAEMLRLTERQVERYTGVAAARLASTAANQWAARHAGQEMSASV